MLEKKFAKCYNIVMKLFDFEKKLCFPLHVAAWLIRVGSAVKGASSQIPTT